MDWSIQLHTVTINITLITSRKAYGKLMGLTIKLDQ